MASRHEIIDYEIGAELPFAAAAQRAPDRWDELASALDEVLACTGCGARPNHASPTAAVMVHATGCEFLKYLVGNS